MLELKWRDNLECQYKLEILILENEILNTIFEIVNSLILDKSKLTSVLQVLDDGKTHSYHGQFPRLVEGFRNGSLIKPGISDTINRYALARVT